MACALYKNVCHSHWCAFERRANGWCVVGVVCVAVDNFPARTYH